MPLLTLTAVQADPGALVGGKARNCARLLDAGFPVPDGVVLTADADDSTIDRIAGHSWFASLPSTETFAVRSSGIDEDSAGHSFAGVHETELNVSGNRLAGAVRRCRASAHSAQAQSYRAAQGLLSDLPDLRALPARPALPAPPALPVLIQRMVPAVVSGVAFTVNPATGADDIVVNSAPGLGEALVGGTIDPDEFIVAKAAGHAVRSTRVGSGHSSASLTNAQLVELAALALRVERFYGAPQDIEWCQDGRAFWIVQARPVTGVGPSPDPPAPPALPAPPAPPAPPDPEWTRANFMEVLPDLMSPQALYSFEEGLETAERRYMGRIFAPVEELGRVVRVFHGRLYFNLSQLRHVAAVIGAPAADVLRSIGHSEALAAEDHVARTLPIAVRLRAAPDLLRATFNDLRMRSLMRAHDAVIKQALERLTSVNPCDLTDAAIWDAIVEWADAIPDRMQIVFAVAGVQARESMLRNICERVGCPYDRLVYPVLSAGRRSVSTQQAIDLMALADVARDEPRAARFLANANDAFSGYRKALEGTAFLDALDRFLASYGHRGRYESDWAIPRYSEDPSPLLFAVRSHLDSPPRDAAAAARGHEDAAAAGWREFRSRLSWWQRLTLLPLARALLARVKQQYVWREQVRSDLVRVLAQERVWLLALADRFAERGWIDRRDDFFLLRLEEVGAAIADPAAATALRAIADRRTAELAAQRDLRMPLLMRESELPALLRASRTSPPPAQDGRQRLLGLCVSPGRAEAEVVVMLDPREFATMKRGAILVAPATDPSWTPLFTLASGVIVEVGGMLSHASTIAREYGLPALANVKDATTMLRTGDRVTLEASAGYVERHDR